MLRKSWSARVRVGVAAGQNFRCALCSQMFGEAGWEIDHKIALANGGPDDFLNLQALCHACHALKTQKDMFILRTRTSPFFDRYSPEYLRTPARPTLRWFHRVHRLGNVSNVPVIL